MTALRKPQQQAPQAPTLAEVLEQAIHDMTNGGKLSPRAQVAFEGHSFALDTVRVPKEAGGDDRPQLRNVSTAPLESLYFRKVAPIELYQYAAGTRFRLDWTQAQISPLRAVDYAQAAIYATEAVQKAYRDGYDGRGAGSALRGFTEPADRLDALKRLGDALGAVSPMSGWMAQTVVGQEWTLAHVAAAMGVSDRYVIERMRETLDELARHYRMVAGARIARQAKRA